MESMPVTIATISVSIGILYIVIILMIWVISAIPPPINEDDLDSEGDGRRTKQGVDLSGKEVDTSSHAMKRSKRTMNISEIARICNILEISEGDHVANEGSDLLDLLDSLEKSNLEGLYLSSDHNKLQRLANYRIRMKPGEISTRRLMIKSLYSMRKYTDCVKQCEEILEISNNHVDGLRYLARSNRALGNHEESMVQYRILGGILFRDREVMVANIRFQMENGNFIEALSMCEEILEMDPEDRDALIYSARIHNKIGDVERAIGTWELLLGSGVDDFEALLGMGRLYYSMGMDSEAEKFLEESLEINPGDNRVRKTLIQVYSRSGSLKRALSMIEDFCISEPSDISNWEKNLVTRFRSGEEEIESIFNEIITLNGGSSDGYAISAALAKDFGFDEKGDEIIAKGMVRHGENPRFYKLLSNFSKMFDDLTMEYKFLIEGRDIDGEEGILETDLKTMKRFLKVVGLSESDLDLALRNDETIFRTSCVVERIFQLSASKIESSWASNKKIAMTSSSLGRGGAERQVVACLDGISSDNIWDEVRLYCNKINKAGVREATYEEEVQNLGVMAKEIGSERDSLEMDMGEWEILVSLLPEKMKKTIIPLYHEIRDFGPSILHSWQDVMNINSAIAGMIAGVPKIILFARSMRPDLKTVLHYRGRGYLKDSYVSIINRNRAILAHNCKAGAISYSVWLGIEKEKIQVIHNGINFDQLEGEADDEEVTLSLQEVGVKDSDRIVGSVFRIVEEKDPELWIEVASEVLRNEEDLHFIIVGGGVRLESMRDLVDSMELSGRIHLVGQSARVGSWLKRMDLFFNSSKVEGLPNAIIEAQGMGVPVIATDAGGSREALIDGVTGSIIEGREKSELADNLLNWLGMGERELAEASKLAIENSRRNFSVEAMYGKLVKIYELGGHSG